VTSGAILPRMDGATAPADTDDRALAASSLQRAHRDVHAGSHHVILGWDGPAEQYGRVRSGLEPTDVVL